MSASDVGLGVGMQNRACPPQTSSATGLPRHHAVLPPPGGAGPRMPIDPLPKINTNRATPAPNASSRGCHGFL
jgi:hypothetical protein